MSMEGVAIGFAPTLIEPAQLHGMEVFAGQNCNMFKTPVCDHAMIFKREDVSYAVFWQVMYSSQNELPESPRHMIEQFGKSPPMDAIRAVDLNSGSYAAFAEMSEARRKGTAIRFAALMAGASGVTAGAHTNDPELTKAGIETYQASDSVTASLSADEAKVVEQYPELLPVLHAIELLGQSGVFCSTSPGSS
jgi:hypothetical protein